VGKPHVGIAKYYIGSLMVVWKLLGLGPAKRCKHRRCSRQPPTTRRRAQTTDATATYDRTSPPASALTNFYTAPGRATVASRNPGAPGIPPPANGSSPLDFSQPTIYIVTKESLYLYSQEMPAMGDGPSTDSVFSNDATAVETTRQQWHSWGSLR